MDSTRGSLTTGPNRRRGCAAAQEVRREQQEAEEAAAEQARPRDGGIPKSYCRGLSSCQYNG